MGQIAWSDETERFVCRRCCAHLTVDPAAVRTGELLQCTVCGAVGRAPRTPLGKSSGRPQASASRISRFLRRERRRHPAQRAAVVRLLSQARGEPSLMRPGGGTVFVYDDRRRHVPPQTVRAHVWPNGEVELDAFHAPTRGS